jgi:hypothetical protein
MARLQALLLLALVTTLACPAAAGSRTHDGTVKRHGRALKTGRLTTFGSKTVHDGKRNVRLDAVVAKTVAEQRTLAKDLRRARGGIQGAVVETQEVSELADRFVVTLRTGAIVTDPNAVGRASKRFKRSRKARKRQKLAQLDAKARQGLSRVAGKAKKLPRNHPLRQAVDRGGEQGLLDAMADGKGYWGVSQTTVIPKTSPKPRQTRVSTKRAPARRKTVRVPPPRKSPRVRVPGRKKPRVRVPNRKPGKRPRVRLPGKRRGLDPFDVEIPIEDGELAVVPLDETDHDPFGLFPEADDETEPRDETEPWDDDDAEPMSSNTTSSGSDSYDFKLLAGVTVNRVWERTYIVGDDEWTDTYFKLYFYADAGVGMRFPLTGSATLDPKRITVTGSSDRAEVFKTEFTVNTKEAKAQFYRDVGLAENKVYGGKELVLTASVVMHAYVFIGGGSPWWDFRVAPGIDEGANFTPPQSETWQYITEFFVPASVTNTDWTIAGYGITGRVGAKVEGNGMPMVDVRARANGQSADSWLGSESAAAGRDTNTLRFPNRNGQRNIKANTTGGCANSCTRDYGYRIFNASYDANFRVVPGIKITGYLGFPIYEDLSTTLWLNNLAVDMGSYVFGPHAGTTSAVMRNTGTKTFTKQ